MHNFFFTIYNKFISCHYTYTIKHIVKQSFCALCWLVTKINIQRCTVIKISKFLNRCYIIHVPEIIMKTVSFSW